MSKIKKSADAINMTINDLRKQGIETPCIIAALADVCVQQVLTEPREQATCYFTSVMAVLAANAKTIS